MIKKHFNSLHRINAKAVIIATFSAFSLLPFFGLSLHGSERLSESFTSPIGNVPPDWKMVAKGREVIAEIQEISDTNQTALLIQRPGKNPANALVYYEGPGTQQFGNFTASVTFSYDQQPSATSSSRGILLRAQVPQYERAEGYYIAVEPYNMERALSIFWNPISHVENELTLATSPIQDPLNPHTKYILEVSAKGHVIEASLWSTTPAGAKDQELASVMTDEAVHAGSGYFGLRSAHGNSGPVSSWFHSLHLQENE